MNYVKITSLLVLAAATTSCAICKKEPPLKGNARTPVSTEVQSVNLNQRAHQRAASLTNGWPQSSVEAAKEMVVRYGEPSEVTENTLVWNEAAPFKRVIVHKVVYSNRFPLLHQTAVEHVVNYDAREDKVDDIWKFDGSIVLNRTKGEMSASGQSEAMNILSLNLAHEIMQGKKSPSGARIQHGKETMNFLNGNKTAATQTLSFGNQINTTDTGETITKKIRSEGDTKLQTRQAQEAAQP